MFKSRRALIIGVMLAGIDGVLMAFWGLSTKYLGNASPNIFAYALVLLVAGICYFGLAMNSKADQKIIKTSPSLIKMLTAFVLISILQFSIGIYLFEFKDAEISVSAFLRNSSLVFAAIISHFAWAYPKFCNQVKITPRLMLGIIIFTLGSWLFVGYPSSIFKWLQAISLWGALSILIGFNRSITEIITFKFNKESNSYTMNLFVGVGFIVTSLPLCIALIIKDGINFSRLPIISILAVAIIIPAGQMFRFYSYNYLKDVIGKKGIGVWCYLLASFALGVFSGENFELHKMLALFVGLIAVFLLEDGLFATFWSKKAQ